MKRTLFALLIVTFLVTLIFAGCATQTPTTAPAPAQTTAPAPAQTTAPKPATTTAAPITSAPAATQPAAKTIELKAVSFLPRNTFQTGTLLSFIQKVNERAKGEVTMRYLGGPEIMPPPNFAEAVRRGVVDVAHLPGEMYDGLVPVGSALTLSVFNPVEERANGAYAVVNELHNKVGLYFLERGTAFNSARGFQIITNKPTPTTAELKGQRLAASTNIMDATLKSFGAVPVLIPNTEHYTAAERGVADGVIQPINVHMDLQLHEVVKYVVEPAFLRGGVTMILNLDTWNKLSPGAQKVVTDCAIEAIVETAKQQDSILDKGLATAKEKGMQFFTWSATDVELFNKRLQETGWADRMAKYPEATAKLKPLLTKK